MVILLRAPSRWRSRWPRRRLPAVNLSAQQEALTRSSRLTSTTKRRSPLGAKLPLSTTGIGKLTSSTATAAARRCRACRRRRSRSAVAHREIADDRALMPIWAATPRQDLRGARPRVHARRSDVHDRQSVGSRLRACTHTRSTSVISSRRRRLPRLRNELTDAVRRSAESRRAPRGCIDCHDPRRMTPLSVPRGSSRSGVRAARAWHYYPNARDAPGSARRCGHAMSRILRGAGERLTYPWANGLKADESLAITIRAASRMWHASRRSASQGPAPASSDVNQGSTALGLAGADCHMPTARGAEKINITTCSPDAQRTTPARPVTDRGGGDPLRVELIPDRHMEIRNQAMDAVVALSATSATPRRRRLRQRLATRAISARRSSCSTSWRPETRPASTLPQSGAHPARRSTSRARGSSRSVELSAACRGVETGRAISHWPPSGAPTAERGQLDARRAGRANHRVVGASRGAAVRT